MGASCSSCDRQWFTILITMFREVFEAQRHQTHKNKSIPPSTINGLAERFVQTLKQAIKASRNEANSLRHRIANFLISYRNATHATADESLAQLMIKRDLRSRLHLLQPSLQETVMKKQWKLMEANSGATVRSWRHSNGLRLSPHCKSKMDSRYSGGQV